MAFMDRDALVASCKRYAQRPTSDAQMPDAAWHGLLTEAQGELIVSLSTPFPQHFYGAPTLLATADGGKTYTFGTDADGDNIVPFGAVEIYANENGRPYYASSYDSYGADAFVVEGDKIRMPLNRPRTFSNGPYARFVVEPGVIDSVTEVDSRLRPKQFRQLLVWDALTRWCSIGQFRDPTTYQQWFARDYEKAVLALATQYANSATSSSGESWWGAWWQTLGAHN